MAVPVNMQSAAQRTVAGTVYGVPTPVTLYDGWQSGYAAQKIISAGDSAANTKLAMTRLLFDSVDDLREIVAMLQSGSGAAGLRVCINPGSDDIAAVWLSNGYPYVTFIPAGVLTPIAHSSAITVVYFVPVAINGGTLASTKGNVSVLARAAASARGFADAPLTHLYHLTGGGSQVRSNRAGFPEQFITHSAASWDANTGEWAGNGAAYGTLPADIAAAFSGYAPGDKLIIGARIRASSITSNKYYFGMGRSGGGTGNKSGCISLQQTGSGPVAFNYRLGSANDDEHTTTDTTISSTSVAAATAKSFAWILNIGELTDELSVYVNNTYEFSGALAKPSGGLVYPYYDSSTTGAVVGARYSSSAISDFLAAGEFERELFIAKYPNMSMVDAIAIVKSLYTHPGALSSGMR